MEAGVFWRFAVVCPHKGLAVAHAMSAVVVGLGGGSGHARVPVGLEVVRGAHAGEERAYTRVLGVGKRLSLVVDLNSVYQPHIYFNPTCAIPEPFMV